MTDALALLAAPRRREILRLVWRRELAAGEISAAFPDVTFGAISQQLAVLERAGVLSARREGRRRFYRAHPEALGPVGEALAAMWDDALYRLRLHAELEAGRRGPRPRRRKKPSRRQP